MRGKTRDKIASPLSNVSHLILISQIIVIPDKFPPENKGQNYHIFLFALYGALKKEFH